MKKLILLVLLSLLLSACGSAGNPETEPEEAGDNGPAAEAVPEPAETEAEGEVDAPAPRQEEAETAEEEPSAIEEESTNEITSDAEYSIASTVPEAAVIRDSDWVKGAEDPLITIIEYGDFQ